MGIFVSIENGTSLGDPDDAIVYTVDDDDDEYVVESTLSGDDPFDDDVTFSRRVSVRDLLSTYDAARAFVKSNGSLEGYERLAEWIARTE
jgi:hypothetical protein